MHDSKMLVGIVLIGLLLWPVQNLFRLDYAFTINLKVVTAGDLLIN